MNVSRHLIVNADDFGQSPGINRGILRSAEHGIVRSASLMVRWPAAAEAARYALSRSDFSLGLHVDLAEWIYREGAWTPRYVVVALNDTAEIADEVERQLAAFRDIAGRDPTHIDSHQHVHRSEPIRYVVAKLARQLGVPLRDYSSRVRYCGDFYGQTATGTKYQDGITSERLIAILRSLPPGITELGCHPGEGRDGDSMYNSERAEEVKTLCDPGVRATLASEGIELCSFHYLSD